MAVPRWLRGRGPEFSEQEALNGEIVYTDADEALAAATTPAMLKRRERIRYQGAVVVAVTVAVLGAAIELAIRRLTSLKLGAIESMSRRGELFKAGLVLCGTSAGLCLAAGLMVVLIAPRAKGSGIPEIKTYLNGVGVHGVISERTLIVKFAGIVCSVSGGLLCGKEGPMVHIGSIVGAIVAQGRSETLNGRRTVSRPRYEAYKFLNCDREKTEFVAIGCACGVSSAFGSPIGGVLFMIEEALSFWRQRLFFRATFAATVNCVVIVLLLSKLRNKNGHFTHLIFQGMAVFDGFPETAERDFPAVLLALNVLIGGLVGLWGAAFVETNRRLTLLRSRIYASLRNPRTAKIAEVVLAGLGTALMAYVPAVSGGRQSPWCRPRKDPKPYGVDQEHASRFQCAEGEYNELATLTLNSLSKAIAALFHQKSFEAFSATALAYFFAYSSFWSCVTYGLNAPSGLFVPSILCGTVFGRLFAVVALPMFFPGDTDRNLGFKTQTCAIAGGIAGLAATTRMTVSIVTIFASTILDGAHLVPILVSCLSSKLAGDLFNEGLYDVHIHLAKYMYMEDEPPGPLFAGKRECREDEAGGLASSPPKQIGDDDDGFDEGGEEEEENGPPLPDAICSNHAWSTNIEFFMTQQTSDGEGVKCVACRRPKYSDLIEVLRSSTHHAFPVVDDKSGAYVGLISRGQLCVVLNQAEPQDGTSILRVENADTRDFFPHFPLVGDLPPTFHPDATVDLSPFVNRSALALSPDTNARFVWELFRSTRMRHVVVVDQNNRHVLGIVTRCDILTHQHTQPQQTYSRVATSPEQ